MRITFLILTFILLVVFFIKIPSGYSESQNNENLFLLEQHLLNFDMMNRENPPVYPIDIVIGDDEKIYVADPYCNSVHIFDHNYKHLTTVEQGILDFEKLYSILTGNDTPKFYDSTLLLISGEIAYGFETTHICNEPYNNKNIFDSYEEFESKTKIPLNVQMGFHEMMTLDGEGRIYVLNVYNSSYTKKIAVHVFSPDGKYMSSFGHKGSDDELLVKPTGITIDHHGRIYILDNYYTVKVFSSDHKYMYSIEDEKIKAHTSGSINNIKIKSDNNRQAYLVNKADAHFNIISFKNSSHIDIPQIKSAWSMTVDNEGKVYVGDIMPHSVMVFSFKDDQLKIQDSSVIQNNKDISDLQQNITKSISVSSLTKNELEINEKKITSPAHQFKSGIPAIEIQCKIGLDLLIKINGEPVCVKPITKIKLIERGWN